jgi:hypothetical protein
MELEIHGKLFFGIDRTTCIAKLDRLVKVILWVLAAVVVGLFPLILGLIVAWAGPPFVTDDPEPI